MSIPAAAASLDYFGPSIPLAGDAPGNFGSSDGAVDVQAAISSAWYLRQRDTRRALALCDACAPRLAGSPGAEARRGSARIALIRAEAAWLYSDDAAAQTLLGEARRGFTALRDDIGLGDAWLCEASMVDRQGGDAPAAIREAAQAYARSGDLLRIALADTWLACRDSTAAPGPAAERWNELLERVRAIGHPGLTTFVEGALASQAYQRGDLAGTVEHLERAFDAAQQCGQVNSAITVASNLGIAFSTLGDDEGALQWMQRARELAEPTGWPYAINWCLAQSASVLIGMGRAQAAHELLSRGLPMLERFSGSRNYALATQVMAEVALARQQPAEALIWSDRSLKAALRLDFPDLASGSLRFRALALARLNRPDEAMAAAGEGLAIARERHHLRHESTLLHAMATIERERAASTGEGAAPPATEGTQVAGATGVVPALAWLQQAFDTQMRSGAAVPAEWQAELSRDLETGGDLAGALRHQRLATEALARGQAQRALSLAVGMQVRHRTETARAEAAHQRALARESQQRLAQAEELARVQRELEQQRMQGMLVHAGKMVAVGRLASGLVHEMSHPVGTLLLIAETLVETLRRQEDRVGNAAADARALVHEAERLAQIVRRLRNFARADSPDLAHHPLQAVMADARALYSPRLALERIACDESIPPMTVYADTERLSLAIANLVFNAADAMQGRPERRLWIAARQDGAQVALSVRDSGPGLSESVRSRLFEPFFTTKPEGHGLGLGLAVSAESVASMGGRLVAANAPSGGAEFTILLAAEAPGGGVSPGRGP